MTLWTSSQTTPSWRCWPPLTVLVMTCNSSSSRLWREGRETSDYQISGLLPRLFWSVRPSYREGYVCSCGHCLVTWRHAARHGPDHQDVYCIGTALKERLLLSHNLLLVQKAAKVLSMLAVWDRRPSQLLADLLEFCPPVEEISAFFRAIFVQRLTASVAEPVFLTGSGS